MEFVDREFRPVILGADITAYSLMRTFYEEYKVKSILVNMSENSPISESSMCDTYSFDKLEDKEVFLSALKEVGEKHKDKKLLILGCGDWYVRMLIENKNILSKYYIIPYIDEELMNKIVLKDKFYDILSKLDIPHPKTFVYDLKEKNDLDFNFEYPIVAKTADSARYHYAKFPGKKKVFTFNNKEDLEGMLRNLEQSSYDYKFLIQDRIPGDDTHMRVLTCYSDQKAKVRFASFGHVLLEEHTPTALGNPCCIVNEVELEVVDQAKKFLEYIGYTGFSNFDLKYDERDGKYKFFEINIRLGRSNFYVTSSGFNVARLMVEDLIYKRELDYTIADKEHLFTFVPKYVIKNFVKDSPIKAKALSLMKEGKWSNPLYFKGEKNLRTKIYGRLASINQIKKFNKYCKKAK